MSSRKRVGLASRKVTLPGTRNKPGRYVKMEAPPRADDVEVPGHRGEGSRSFHVSKETESLPDLEQESVRVVPKSGQSRSASRLDQPPRTAVISYWESDEAAWRHLKVLRDLAITTRPRIRLRLRPSARRPDAKHQARRLHRFAMPKGPGVFPFSHALPAVKNRAPAAAASNPVCRMTQPIRGRDSPVTFASFGQRRIIALPIPPLKGRMIFD